MKIILMILIGAIEFYTWVDEHGIKHVSNVPRECIVDGAVLLGCGDVGTPQPKPEITPVYYIGGEVDSVLSDGLIIIDPRVGQVETDKKGIFDITVIPKVRTLEGRVFIRTDPSGFFNKAEYRGYSRRTGTFSYTTVLGAPMTIPAYSEIARHERPPVNP